MASSLISVHTSGLCWFVTLSPVITLQPLKFDVTLVAVSTHNNIITLRSPSHT